MDIVIGLIAFVFMLSVIVIIHELGHFLAAKHYGVFCKEFSIGMGPLLYSRQGKETQFSIRAIPFGGYVMMAGEEDGSQDEEDEWLKELPENRRLNHKPRWQQIIIMAAGVCMNVLLAWVLFVGLSIAQGYVVEDPIPQVYEVTENSAAQQAGLQKGDLILEASNGKDTIKPATQYELLEWIQYHHENLELTIQRDNQTLEIQADPVLDEETNTYTYGYVVQANAHYISWYEGFYYGTLDMLDSGTAIFSALAHLVQGEGLQNLSGPVGIAQVTTQATAMGLSSYLSLFALISMNIGVFNILPIPAMDGGRILILILEKIFGRKINTKIVENVILASFVLLIGLFLFATYNDILRLF
ncbi:RIP metalloprotease RseP [uncultured Faecalicoccus sp.]|uniref:RIP metalloprotease RseP n=1 Tax=uncultured Faecalicoccus sp. TaxID=1971760 RepID=UPI00260C1191|nr:RIP metalloprotease RseP [uncultured Faecalicoccus sp.]